MKEHPGHFWICFWLFLILTWGTVDDRANKNLDRVADTLGRIEKRLDAISDRLP